MTGTFLNMATVLLGGSLGLWFGRRFPPRIRETVMHGLGLFTIAIGLSMSLETRNALVILGSALVGGILGEWWGIEAGLGRLGGWLETKVAGSAPAGTSAQSGSRFVRGFVTASLVFCVGPMTVVGSIQDGLTGDYQLLAIKSVLDGFAALAFAASLGAGVLFSVLVILTYQGGLSLLAAQAQSLLTPAMVAELTAAGGLLIMGIGVSSLLELRAIRVANFLPALLIAPLIVAVLQTAGIGGY